MFAREAYIGTAIHRISSQSFFCDVYPHPVVLSAGNSCTLPVTFRPVEKVCIYLYICM